MTEVLAACAGGAGAAARFVVDGFLRSRIRTALPIGIAVINLVGSFLLGLLVGARTHGWLDSATLAVLGTGFCGGFTTFSTAMLDVVQLLLAKRFWAPLGFAVAVAAGAVALAALGFRLTG